MESVGRDVTAALSAVNGPPALRTATGRWLCSESLNKLLHKNPLFGRAFSLRPIKLVIVKPAIVAGFVQQLGMRADLLNAAIIHHDDLIGRQNGGEPMGNCDYGSSGGELLERLLNLLFRFGIERRRRLVEQQNRRIFQNCACNREPLLLSPERRQPLSPMTVS